MLSAVLSRSLHDLSTRLCLASKFHFTILSYLFILSKLFWYVLGQQRGPNIWVVGHDASLPCGSPRQLIPENTSTLGTWYCILEGWFPPPASGAVHTDTLLLYRCLCGGIATDVLLYVLAYSIRRSPRPIH